MFDVSPAYIKKHFGDDIEAGKHFIYVGKLKRYSVDEMKKLLITQDKQTPHNDLLDRFLI